MVVYIGDGGIDGDPAPRSRGCTLPGARAIALGRRRRRSTATAWPPGRQQPERLLLLAVGGAGVDFAFNNLNQDLCRNLAPFVSAGGDQGVYGVRLPSSLTLNGEVHDDGPGGDQRLTSEWTVVSGPGPVTFADATVAGDGARCSSSPAPTCFQLAAIGRLS